MTTESQNENLSSEETEGVTPEDLGNVLEQLFNQIASGFDAELFDTQAGALSGIVDCFRDGETEADGAFVFLPAKFNGVQSSLIGLLIDKDEFTAKTEGNVGVLPLFVAMHDGMQDSVELFEEVVQGVEMYIPTQEEVEAHNEKVAKEAAEG